MPRPGPRPYECVRRAWHSDRHQPIRGSFIREIFRVVNEIHSPATKKNKEWQEKLPTVVLKAEEILYSKANSESEYMDLGTLLDRTTDAINTIIRRDESTESGVLLHPCIEAALTLGCTPRRASRSQRNCSPQRYLNSNSQQKDHLRKEICPNNLQPKSNHYPDTNHLLGSEKVTLCSNDLGSNAQPRTPPSPYSVYPLYYRNNFPGPKNPCRNFEFLHDRRYKDGNFPNPCSSVDKPLTERENRSEIKCDLSLRLGPHSAQVLSVRGSNSPIATSESYGGRAQGGRDFPSRIKNSTAFKTWSMQGELQDVDADNSVKKRKLLFGSMYVEDRQQCNAFL